MKVVRAVEAAGFTVRRGRQQTMLYLHGRKVGGWNSRERHWYVSKVIAGSQEGLLLRHGFRWREKGRHAWWQLDGVENECAFLAVVEGLTGAGIDPNQRRGFGWADRY